MTKTKCLKDSHMLYDANIPAKSKGRPSRRSPPRSKAGSKFTCDIWNDLKSINDLGYRDVTAGEDLSTCIHKMNFPAIYLPYISTSSYVTVMLLLVKICLLASISLSCASSLCTISKNWSRKEPKVSHFCITKSQTIEQFPLTLPSFLVSSKSN